MEPYLVKIETDNDIEDPSTFCSSWKHYSFHRHSKTKPEDIGLADYLDPKTNRPKVTDRKLATKLKNGLAWWLACYEHGNVRWMFSENLVPGTYCPWDTAVNAGLLVWEHKADEMGAKTRDKRGEDAMSFLKTYNDWVNGYGLYWLVNQGEEHIASCGGYYESDSDYVLSEIADAVGSNPFSLSGDEITQHYADELRKLIRSKGGQEVDGVLKEG